MIIDNNNNNVFVIKVKNKPKKYIADTSVKGGNAVIIKKYLNQKLNVVQNYVQLRR